MNVDEPKRLTIQLPPEIAAKLEWLCQRQLRNQTGTICYAIDRMWQAEQAQIAKAAAAASVSFTAPKR